MIATFELERYLDASPDKLPLGYKQRLALACALMHRPPVLFLDEPTSGVDPITRREFWTHINGLVRSGVTVLVTTHFMDEAEYCDRVALMYRSKLIALDPPDALKQRAATDAQSRADDGRRVHRARRGRRRRREDGRMSARVASRRGTAPRSAAGCSRSCARRRCRSCAIPRRS